MITTEQTRIIHTLLTQTIKADKDEKAHLISSFTEDKKKGSTKDLTFVQANEMILSLGGRPVILNKRYTQFDKDNRQHMTILSLCHQKGWTIKHKGRYIADMKALSSWLMSKRSPVQKPIIDMSGRELGKVIEALKNIVNS